MEVVQQRGSDWDIVNKMLGCWATQAPKTQFVAWEGLETSWQILAKVVGWNICHEGGQKTWNKPWQTCLIRTKKHWWNIGAFPTIQNSQCCGNFILNPQILSLLDGFEEPHCWHLMVQYSPMFNPNDNGVPIWVGKQTHVCWLECQSINRWFSIWWFKQSTKKHQNAIKPSKNIWGQGKNAFYPHNYGKSPFLLGKSTINGHFQ